MSTLFNIGVQALTSNQTALSYTGQNIANVNTEGYSRQRVDFVQQQPPVLGVMIGDIQRLTDQYLVEQVWRDQASLSSNKQMTQKIALLDNLMVSDSTSLSSQFDDFFTALQRTADDPLFIANRELLLAEAEQVVSSFQNFDARLRDQQTLMTTEIRSITTSINSISRSIADLNVKISTMAAGRQNYNTLEDERDQLIKELSQYISVDVLSSDGGITKNISLSNGEPLIVAGRTGSLSIRDGSPDPSQVDIYLSRGAVEAKVTKQLGEGALGGIFSYRDEVLQPVISEIGRLAIVFSNTMNEQHRKGMDLNGDMGGDLFRQQTKGVASAADMNKSVGVRPEVGFYDVSALTASDYELEMTGVESFRIKRLSDGKIFESADLVEGLSATPANGEFAWTGNNLKLTLEGFTLNITGAEKPVRGDRFLVQPTIDGARQMELSITNPRMLALASPIRVTSDVTNSGNVVVEDIQITDQGSANNSNLRTGTLTPITVEFLTSNTYSINGGAAQGYVSGEAINFGEFTAVLRNAPAVGDSLIFGPNTKGFSDNSNALALAALQKQQTVDGYSYQDSYGQMLARVGTQANVASTAYSSSLAVLQASEEALSSIAGVNLDEEAAKLIQFQQAYVASTRLISTYQTIFDSLIGAVR